MAPVLSTWPFIAIILCAAIDLNHCYAFMTPNTKRASFATNEKSKREYSFQLGSSKQEKWAGEVVSNTDDGKIRGCKLTRVENSLTEWVVEIDGIEADLGKFSEAIYRKITSDAKQQRFQGFRPGTIPPHLLSNYVEFSMDECAREATLEAIQQNDIRPFEDARDSFVFETISIPPKKVKGKKKGGRKKKKESEDSLPLTEVAPEWKTFDTMKEAIKAGWKPGQSFSFVVSGVKGQKVNNNELDGVNDTGPTNIDLNTLNFDS